MATDNKNDDDIRLPGLDLESKRAYKIMRHEGTFSRAMHYAFLVGDDQVLVVEDIPENYPRLTVYVTDRMKYEALVKEHRKEWEVLDTC